MFGPDFNNRGVVSPKVITTLVCNVKIVLLKFFRDPFQLPAQANLRTYAADKRKSLMANTYSDHMVYLKAFIKWQDSVKYRRERLFCSDFFISPSTMETILKTRSQLLGQLRAAKFVPTNGTSIMALNAHSENWPLVKAVISSGLYPKLAFKKSGHYCTRFVSFLLFVVV